MADLNHPLPTSHVFFFVCKTHPHVIWFHHLIGFIPVYLLQSPADVIYPLLFTVRTVVLTIPHLNPAWVCSDHLTPYVISLVHVKYEVNVPLVFMWRLAMSVFMY